jgi:hypothetical protein
MPGLKCGFDRPSKRRVQALAHTTEEAVRRRSQCFVSKVKSPSTQADRIEEGVPLERRFVTLASPPNAYRGWRRVQLHARGLRW